MPVRISATFTWARRCLFTSLVVAVYLLAAGMSQGAITYRGASSAGGQSANLTVSKPSGVQAGDVMVASVAIYPAVYTYLLLFSSNTSVTPPSGWTLVRSIATTSGGSLGLLDTSYGSRTYIYYKVATASESSSYTWSGTGGVYGAAGGIAAFSGVDTTNPIVAESGAATASSLNHTTPSISTGTVTNTMLVGSFSTSSSGTWTPPSGMTEVVDKSSSSVYVSTGITLEMNYQAQSSSGNTGTRTATFAQVSDTGAAHLLALRPGSTAVPLAEYWFDECSYTGTDYGIADHQGSYPAKVISTSTLPSTKENGPVQRYLDLSTYDQNFIPKTTIPVGSSWSVSAWVKMPFLTTGGPYHILASVSGGGDLMFVDSNKSYRWGVYIAAGNVATYGSYSFSSLSGWHHIGLVGSAGKTSLYVDGVYKDIVNSQATGQVAYLGTSYDYYGTSSAEGFRAPIDEMVFFSGALSATQIATIYTNQSGGSNWDGTARSDAICLSAPVAEYHMDQCSWNGTSGELIDSSGNGLNGTGVAAPTSVDVTAEGGGICRAASLNGASYFNVPDNNLLDITNNLTAMAWINLAALPSGDLKSILSKDTNYEFHVNSSGQVYWWWQSSGTAYNLTTTSQLSTGQWYHVAVRFASGTATIFINGSPVTSKSGYPTTLTVNNDPLQIGSDYITSRIFNGKIDEVMVFNSALNDAAVKSIYTQNVAKRNYDGTSRVCVDCTGLVENFILSTSSDGGTLGSPSVTLAASSLYEYDPAANTATLYSNLGKLFSSGTNVANAVHVGGDGYIYFCPAGAVTTTDGLRANESDILRYNPITGVVTLFFDGNSLFSSTVAIDALYITSTGTFIFSTDASSTLNGVSFDSGDLVSYTPSTGATSIYLKGSTIFSGTANIDACHVLSDGRILLSTDADAQIGSSSFKRGDVVLYSPTTNSVSLFFDGLSKFGSDQNIDGLTMDDGVVAVDHYELVHDGVGLTCIPEDIKVVACLNTDCSIIASTESSITLSPTGWVDGDMATFTGSVTKQLRHTAAGTVTLGISDQNPLAAGGYRCVATVGGASVSCNMQFYDSGFAFSVPTQTSGKISSAIQISAIGKDPTGQHCVPAFANRSATVYFYSTYLSPTSGTMPLQVNGTTIATASPGTGVSLYFDANGESSITVKYNDAGSVRLNALFQGTGDEAGLAMTGQSDFVVHPAGLCVYSDDSNSDCSSDDGSCTPFVAAGALFNLKVKGVAWESDSETNTQFCDTNSTTPNYRHVGIGISHNLVAPLTGRNGAITSNTADISTGGEVAVNQSVSEVGVFSFTADPPNDYLGAGDVFGGATYTSANIGRFIPGHFEVAIAPDPPAFADAQASYTYLGQPFNWSTVPQFTVTAMNSASTPVATENYEGSFFKLDNELEYSYLDVTVPSAASPLTPASSSQTLPDTSDCGGKFTVTFVEASGFNYTRPSPDNPVSPFTPNVTLTIPADEMTDSDGVCYKTTGSCLPFIRSGIIGANIRHGRSLLEPVYGPETSPLTMSATVHWYNSTAWVQNVDDDYTSFSDSHLASGLTVSISPVSPLTMTDGLATMLLTPTGTTHAGTVTVSGDFPSWLEPDPSAVAVFGIARGNDRIINWQEKIR